MFKVNPLGKQVNEYLMKWALPLGLFFILEYCVSNAATSNVLLGLFTFPMMLVTPVALWWILRRLRRQVLGDAMLGIQAWSFGVQLMFFAGLIEALFIYVFNQFISPTNLMEVQQATLAQYEQAYQLLQGMGGGQMVSTMQEAINVLREASVPTAIETAITALSNDIFIGFILMIPILFIVRKKPVQ